MKKHDILKRIASVFLTAAILIQSLYSGTEAAFAEVEATGISLSAISSDVHMFTNLKFKAGSDNVETGTGTYKLSGTAAGYTVYAGNETYEGNRYQSTQNIEITAAGAAIDSLILNPVGADLSKQIVIDVTGASEFTAVEIADNAEVVIRADAALTIGTVKMGEDSSLTISADSNSVAIGSISSAGNEAAGDVTLSGSTFTAGSISAKNVTLSDCTLSGVSADAYVTASDSFTIDNAAISTFSLVGYPDTSTGAKTLTVKGTSSFSSVAAIGASESCTANIAIDGTFSLTDSYAIEDFNLSYYRDTDELGAESSWPVSYRVRFSGGLDADNAKTIGYHEAGGAFAAGTVTLPTYAASGYGYAGWILEGTASAVTALPDGICGGQKMTVKLEAGSVTITCDLMFDPGETTCDNYESVSRTTTETAQLGDSISLAEPERFGYRFTGWKAATGSVHGSHTGTYSAALIDADSSDGYVIRFEAQWEAVEFPFKVFVSGIDTSKVGVIVNGEKYDSLAEFAAGNSHINWVESDAMFQFDTNIAYGESLDSYFTRLGISGNIELYDKTEGSSKQDFLGWVTQIGTNVDQELSCTYEIGSLFSKPDNTTLSEYQTQLMNTPVFISATWGTASYTVTTTVDSSWELVVDGEVQELTADANGNATVPVEYGAELIWRYNISKNANFSGWRFTSTTSTFVTPSETAYSSSNVYISFRTTMPAGNVVATYNDLSKTPIYVDVSKSDITLADSVTSPSGRTVNGFWYGIDMNTQRTAELSHTDSDAVTILVNRMSPLFYDSTKGYFYEYHTDDKLYITSREIETTNQLTIVSARSTYFRACCMVARPEYSANFVYRKAYGTLLELESSGAGKCGSSPLSGKAWGECGNIVISNAITKQYTTYLYYLGSCNTVASIIQSHCRTGETYATTTSNKLYIYGESSTKTTLELGSVIFFGYNEWQKITINEYDNTKHASNPDNCNYLIYETSTKESATKYYILNCIINAEDKRIYDGYGSGTMTNSTVRIGGEKHYSGFSIAGTSYVRIYGDLIGVRSPLTLSHSSSLIVDGGIYTRRSSSYTSAYYGTTSVSTSGCLIIKGNILDTVALSKSGTGVIIANTIAVSKNYSISNGQVITNQFTNSVTAFPTMDSNGDYTYPLITESLIKNTYKIASNARTDLNEDSYPYLNIAHYYGITATYQLSGGSVYLLGDYDTNKNEYDNQRKLLDGTTYSDDNAVADVLNASGLIDENGDLMSSYYGKSLPTTYLNTISSAAKNAYDAQVSEYGEDIFQHECVQIGNTRFDGSSSSPCKTLVSQTGGTLYAAGNLTYFNDTTISGGIIYCAGSLGSKRDFTISGGTVHAKEIGNACTLTVKKNDVLLRYGKTILSGGTIYTDRIGELSHDTNGNASKSTVFVTGTVILNTYSENSTAISMYDDLYVNYVCESGYSVDASSVRDFLFTGNLTPGKISAMPELSADDKYALSAPIGTPAAIWCFNTAGGTTTDYVAADGSINGDKSEYVYKGYESADFYSARETYTLILREGDYNNASYTGKDGTETDFVFTDANSSSDYKGYRIAQVPFGSVVHIEISDPTMYEKNVVWYTDASGTLRNAMSTCDADGNLEFTMPAADTEIYITENLDLYLNKYEISLIDDGFAVEAPSSTRREDASFYYKGNLNIRQSTTAVTYNSVYWESGSGNLLDDGTMDRKVTYCSLNQKMSGTKVGTDIAKSTKVQINISGNVKIAPVNLPGKKTASATTDSTLVFKGSDRSTDALAFYTLQAFDSYRAVGYSTDSTCGNVTFSDLKLSTTAGTYFTKCNSSSYKYCDTKFVNCDLTTAWSSSYVLVANANNLYIDNCNFSITNGTSYTSYVSSSNHVYITNGTKFNYTYGGTYSGYPFWTNMGTLEINDSEVTSSYNTHASSLYINTSVLTGTITLNNGTLNTAGETRLVSLTMNGSSKVNVGTDQKGYLMCESVTVNDNSELNAGYVVVAGHSTGLYTDETTFNNAAKTGTAFVNGSSKTGFVMNGGTANITEFVGGDYNGKVTINGGTLNAKQIGTCGMLFGYKQGIPNTGNTDFVYTYEKTPVGATVTVNGGTVNVLEDGVLGGINSKVNVSGGTINLADKAYIGLSADEQTEVEFNARVAGTTVKDPAVVTLKNCAVNSNGTTGSINAPYSTLNISGSSTAVNVNSIKSDGGNIVIRDAADGAGTNPYTGQEKRKPANVGVIANSISANTITVADGASVYSASVTAAGDGNGTASLIVETGYLSTDGGFSEAKHTDANRYDATANGDSQTVFGIKMVEITYVLDPESVLLSGDEQNVANNNITSYTVTSTAQSITINDAVCAGYYFRGWYLDEELTNQAGSSFNTSFANDITLYAKWEKITVKIAVVIDSTSTSYDLTNEFEGTSWVKNADGSYTSSNYAYVTYGDKIISPSGVSYSNYNTLKYGVTQFEYFADQSGETLSGSTTISQATTMSAEIAEIYRSISDSGKNTSAVIRLHVSGMQNLYATLRLVLNKQNGKPVDAAFDKTSSTTIEYSVSIDAQLKTVTAFAGSGTDRSPGLTTASATGYTFLGWNTNKNATSETTEGWLTGDSYIEETTVAFAIWQANTYRIRFTAGDGQWITAHNDRPAYGSAYRTSMDYYWVYDTPITEDNCFWLINEDSLEGMTELPYAWNEGYKFDHESGWTYSYIDGTGRTRTETISSASALSKVVIQSINTSTFDAKTQRPDEPGLTLTASYTKASVTYNLNGGKWTGDLSTSEKLAYGEALRGMSQTSYPDAGNELIGTLKTEENQLYYTVQSTTAAYFAANGTYTAADYRNKLSRKGYSFCGWYTTLDAAADPDDAASDSYKVGSSPRFEDITVYAGWTANSYYLNLYSFDTQYDYVTYNVAKEAHIDGVSVTVGEQISSTKWPSRTGDWYAYNSGDDASADENKKRFLLGFTFTGLNPGSSSEGSPAYTTYQTYAQIITNLENDSAMFMNEEKSADEKTLVEGSVFNLPEDDVYTAAVMSDTTITIPDYPRGSTINMYATYRERSLVFKERYIDPDGNVQQTIKYSCAWNSWSNYADTYGSGDEEILDQGYSLIGWYINGTTSTAARYPTEANSGSKEKAAADYAKDMYTYKQNAEDLGTYDIVVYTVYVAQVENDLTLAASSDPTSTDKILSSYVLPASMQKGVLSLETTAGTGLNLVTASEMEAHAYDSTWTAGGKTYSADNTVAVTAVIRNGSTSYSYDLTESTISTGKMVSSGWTIELQLHHSRVMTESAADMTMTVKLLFSDKTDEHENTLENQFATENVTIDMTASIYTVKCTVALPETLKDLTVTNYGTFSGSYKQSATSITGEFKRAYGGAIKVTKPVITGYDPESGWTYSGTSYTEMTMPVSAANNGVVDLSAAYTAHKHTLTISSDVLDGWTSVYSDGAGGTADNSYSVPVEVKFDSEVRISKKVSDSVPQFVLVNGEKLDETAVTSDDENWIFTFPDEDVNVTFSDIQTLYLDEGTINITESGYTYKGKTRTWPGNYLILQNKEDDAGHATANVLTLSGDLSGRRISLGNLNISSNDSISLSAAKASITGNGTITARNILVPYDSALAFAGGSTASKLTLTPASGKAGIGGDTAKAKSGEISLKNLEVDMTLIAGSAASGIGSGTQDSTQTSKNITLEDCTVKMKETAGTSAYTGSWIGGYGVSEVTLSGTTVERLDNSTNHTAGPCTVSGKKVSLEKSFIGTGASNSVYNPVYAENELEIEKSEIYLTIQDNLNNNTAAKSPIGTGSTGIIRTDSTIQVTKAGLGSFDALYTGLLKIESAKADIVISDEQILEASLGSIVISETGAVQAGTSLAHAGSYTIIQEGKADSADPCDITVSSISSGKTVSFLQPTSKSDNSNAAGNTAVILGSVKIETDLTIDNEADLDIKNGFAAEKAVTVNSTGHTIKLEADMLDCSGSYTQNGGKLESENNIGGKDIDITLNSVAAEAKNLTGKSITVNGGSITAAEKVGSVSGTAEFKNKAVVKGTSIGAVGTEGSDFTFVTISGDVTFTGTVYRDLYRISYDTNGLDLVTSALPTVYRDHETCSGETFDESKAESAAAIPGNPTGNALEMFITWYIFDDNGTSRSALQEAGYEKPYGISNVTQLSYNTPDTAYADDIVTNADKTKTLTVHAWSTASGTAVIVSGRKFVDFTASSKSVTIENNKAFTLRLTSTGSFIDGRDYYVTFSSNLPAGTEMTLVKIKADGTYDYYYRVLAKAAKTVKFSEFIQNGTTDQKFTLENGTEEEKFLLEVDFSEAASLLTEKITMEYGIIPDGTNTMKLVNGIICSFTAVTAAVIACSANTVSVTQAPSGDSDLSGSKAFIKAVVKDSAGKEVSLRCDASAKLGDVSGVSVTGSTLVFEIGSCESIDTTYSEQLTISGLDAGTYTVDLTMLSGDGARDNLFRNVLSNTVSMTYTVPQESIHGFTDLPWLEAESAKEDETITHGTAEDISITYQTSADNVSISVQKQTESGEFEAVTDNTVIYNPSTGNWSGTETIQFTDKAVYGIYRIALSIDPDTEYDDVYFVYIVR